ncbi:hypothetical protein [Psychrobacter arcticus]|uniref:hypothetical protein n=1 Tax=Psychrobacter arcticus TaxID=334543 RepID=UPI000310CCF5|nr:hypothetical protein [Psychrobacter arcticus]
MFRAIAADFNQVAALPKERCLCQIKHGTTIANIYQWAAKLKDNFTSEASNMTHDVSEKAVAIMLNRLLDAKTAELEAFDKKIAESEGSVDNAEEERSKISDKKDKYQSMIDQLQS